MLLLDILSLNKSSSKYDRSEELTSDNRSEELTSDNRSEELTSDRSSDICSYSPLESSLSDSLLDKYFQFQS